jgi:hypothetical protein
MRLTTHHHLVTRLTIHGAYSAMWLLFPWPPTITLRHLQSVTLTLNKEKMWLCRTLVFINKSTLSQPSQPQCEHSCVWKPVITYNHVIPFLKSCTLIVVRAVSLCLYRKYDKTIENIHLKKDECRMQIVIPPSLITVQHHVWTTSHFLTCRKSWFQLWDCCVTTWQVL